MAMSSAQAQHLRQMSTILTDDGVRTLQIFGCTIVLALIAAFGIGARCCWLFTSSPLPLVHNVPSVVPGS